MLNNVGNFYLSCFVVANTIYNINRFVLQEVGRLWNVSNREAIFRNILSEY